MEMFQNAFRAFNPFASLGAQFAPKQQGKTTAPTKAEEIEALKQSIADMQRELDRLMKN